MGTEHIAKLKQKKAHKNVCMFYEPYHMSFCTNLFKPIHLGETEDGQSLIDTRPQRKRSTSIK